MNHLVVFSHPKSKSFNGAILDRYVSALRRNGHDVEVRDLYKMSFQPLLTWEEYKAQFKGEYADDVKQELRAIEKANVLTFIFPVWWAGLPSIAKGYLDRVFTYGFAYELKGEEPVPLLKGKKAATIFTSGTPEKIYQQSGMVNSIRQTLEEGLFSFCGLEDAGYLYFGNAVLAGDDEHEQMLNQVEQFAGSF